MLMYWEGEGSFLAKSTAIPVQILDRSGLAMLILSVFCQNEKLISQQLIKT